MENGIIPSRKIAVDARKGISRKISANEPAMCRIETVVEGTIPDYVSRMVDFQRNPSIRPSLTDEGLEASIVFAVTPAKNKYLSFNRMEEMVSFLCGNTLDTFEVVVPKGRDKSTWK